MGVLFIMHLSHISVSMTTYIRNCGFDIDIYSIYYKYVQRINPINQYVG